MLQREFYLKAGTCLVALATGCSAEDPTSKSAASSDILSWEDFRQYAERDARMVDGDKVYIVEWDIAITEAELHEYYSRRFGTTSKSTVDVHDITGVDNVWTHPDELALTYCVSSSFGANHSRIRDEMQRATLAWMQGANVAFTYVPTENSNCVDSNPAIEIPVVPYSGGGACAFFPDQENRPHCTSHGRALVIDVSDIDSMPTTEIYGDFYPNITTEGVLRHELGHILGLRHEHIREADNAIANCVGEVLFPGAHRGLTEYDKESVMHYPWCDGTTTTAMLVTPWDAQGTMQLYGPNAWLVAVDVL